MGLPSTVLGDPTIILNVLLDCFASKRKATFRERGYAVPAATSFSERGEKSCKDVWVGENGCVWGKGLAGLKHYRKHSGRSGVSGLGSGEES